MSLIITGVIDGPLSGGVPKAVELYVTASISDLSNYGIGSANNGATTSVEELTFPAVSAAAGDYIYVASETAGFQSFFGFAPDYTDSATNINGDDVIEVFENGSVIDRYGEFGVDGTGEIWEHTDSWASRNPGTTANPTFNAADWNIAGINALDGETSNATAATPFPIGTFGGTTPTTPTITINEIHADPDATIAGDANGDGTRNSGQDEFIEFVNTGSTAADLGGYTISDGASLRHTIPTGTVIAPGEVLVVFGGGTPTGTFNGATVQTASSGALGLNNGGDTITLADAGGAVVVSETYGSEAGNNQSITRDPSLTGPFVEHLTAAGANGAIFSPGELLDGTVTPATPVKIHEIQGAVGTANLDQVTVDDISPLVGSNVIIEAIVTADFQDGLFGSMGDLDGFYVQEEELDYDLSDLTSEGIFIFDDTAPSVDVSVGDLVSITGFVSENFGETRISATNVSVVSSGNMLPTATTVVFPTANVALDDDGDYIANLEAYEGMLINIPQDMVVTELFNLDRFGQYNVSTERLEQFTQNNAPDVAGNDAHLQDNAKKTIVLDDGLTIQNPASIKVIDGNDGILSNTDTFRMGDSIGGATGVVSYGFDEFRIQSGTGTYTASNPRQEMPSDIGGNFKVASLNVLNYFTTIDLSGATTDNGSDPRGADTQAEFDRQAIKLVETIKAIDADILGLVELENDFAGANFAIKDIVDRVNTDLGSTVYGFVDPGQEFVGGDAISNGLIYKVANVNPLGDMAILETFGGRDFIDPLGAGRPLNRPAVAQTFEDLTSGETMTVSVNHFKSKGSLSGLAVDDDQGDGQGNNNATRAEAALILADWLASDPTGQGSANTLILGDLNAYGSEDPVTNLEAAGYTDLADAILGDAAYSYVFDGQIGTLDYALANGALAAKLVGATEWHINSDEAYAFDYNLDFGRDPTLFDGSTAARNSDHDPVIVSFNFDALKIVTVTDDDNSRAWTSVTDTCDSAGQLLSRFMVFDDGRETTSTYTNGVLATRMTDDVADAYAFSTVEQTFNAAGQRVQQTNTFDDGRSLVIDYANGMQVSTFITDLGDMFAWTSIMDSFDASGQRTSRATQFDDGRAVDITYRGGVQTSKTSVDTADAFVWASIDQSYDNNGVLEQQINIYDDGRELVIDYVNGVTSQSTMTDIDDVYVWFTQEDAYDVGGVRTSRTTTFDDGSVVTTSFIDELAIA